MHIAIYGRVINTNKKPGIILFFQLLEKYEVVLHINLSYYNMLKEIYHFKNMVQVYADDKELKRDINLLITLGGDGTILSALPLVKQNRIPIVGINTGRLGFLSTINLDDVEDAFSKIIENKIQLENRDMIVLESENELFANQNYALNECTIRGNDTSSMITIHTYINGTLLNSYWADGIIVSTATGSTAYSMSCGGPVISPQSESFVITPIAPHNLTVRPIVVSNNEILTFKVEGRVKSYTITLDSRKETVNFPTEIIIKKDTYGVDFLKLLNSDFYDTLRKKLNWGLDKRNY
jgi:NAD+ kinase